MGLNSSQSGAETPSESIDYSLSLDYAWIEVYMMMWRLITRCCSFGGDGWSRIEDLHDLSIYPVVLDVGELELFQLSPGFKELLVEFFKLVFFLLVSPGLFSYSFL